MRLIDGDNLEGFAYEPTFGTRDMIENWIEETDLPFEIKAGYDKELKKLCWNVLEGCMNVIKTEETAYDLGKVIDRLENVSNADRYDGMGGYYVGERTVYLDDAIEIVKQGGVSDDVCEWVSASDGEFIQNPHTKRLYSNEPSMKNVYCNTCGEKIKVVE